MTDLRALPAKWRAEARAGWTKDWTLSQEHGIKLHYEAADIQHAIDRRADELEHALQAEARVIKSEPPSVYKGGGPQCTEPETISQSAKVASIRQSDPVIGAVNASVESVRPTISEWNTENLGSPRCGLGGASERESHGPEFYAQIRLTRISEKVARQNPMDEECDVSFLYRRLMALGSSEARAQEEGSTQEDLR